MSECPWQFRHWLHHHAVGQFQQQQCQQQQPAQKTKVEFDDANLTSLVSVGEAACRREQQDQSDQ